MKYPGNHAHRLNLLTIYQEETGNLMRQDHRLIYQTESGLNYLKIAQRILEHMHEFCKTQTEQQIKPEIPDDSDSDSSSRSRAFESEQAKFSRMVEEKFKWGATKVTLLEKMYAQEQETLKLRQLIRNERHTKKETQTGPSLDEKRKELSIEERAREMLRLVEEVKAQQQNKQRLKISSRGMKGLKAPKEAKGPAKPREPKPKKLPKKFHLRYFLMDGETTKQRNKKKKKSGSDDDEDEEDDDDNIDEEEEEDVEEEVEEAEDEDDFPQGFMGFDEPANEDEDDEEDQRKRLDESYIEDMITRENKSNKSSAKRSAEPKRMGNRGLNSLIRNFIYTDTKDEPKSSNFR